MLHRPLRACAALAVAAALTGCATMQSHDKTATDMQTSGRSGGIPAALASLESTAKTEEEKTLHDDLFDVFFSRASAKQERDHVFGCRFRQRYAFLFRQCLRHT